MKKLLSVILCILFVVGSTSTFSTLASAKELDAGKTGYQIFVTSYEQLKNLLKNSPNDERYVLQNDIIVNDNDNDNALIVGSLTRCTLDLNGYILSRSTRGIDNCLIKVNNGASFYIEDSSKDKTGQMVFSSGNYAGTSCVILANGNIDIYGGSFEIKTPYEVGGGGVFLVETGYLQIFDGVFDSHEAFGGDTIELRHNAPAYTVPHCNIYGGTFYGKISNFEVSSFDNFTKYGCFYPSVYVYDGEFYIARPDDEYAGFAYCNNGWGQVIVAGGTTYYKCLNSSDQKYLDNVDKQLISVEYEGKTGYYYEITSPTMIGSDDFSFEERLNAKLSKKEVSYYSKTGTVYQENQEMIDTILNYVDTIEVSEKSDESPLLWIENNENVKTVSWYMSDEAHFDGENTPWSELGDYRGKVNPFRFDFRPQEETTLYIRCLITMDDGEKTEDVIAIHYEEFIPNPPITAVNITGVNTPVVGVTPDFSLDDTSQYYINAVYWKDVTANEYMKESDTFVAGHTYELEVWLRTNDGYKFKTDADEWIDITATIGGKQAEITPPGSQISAIITTTYTLSEEVEMLLGDVDGDTKVSVMDATAIQRHIAKQITLDTKQQSVADTDGDSKISIMDATAIQRYIAKLITEF